jgi:hypothetical protein
MGGHTLKLRPVEGREDASGEADDAMLRITSGSKGVQGGVLDSIDFRRGQASRDGQVFDEPVELFVVFKIDELRPAHREDELVAKPIRCHTHADRKDNGSIQNGTIPHRSSKDIAYADNKEEKAGDIDKGQTLVMVLESIEGSHRRKNMVKSLGCARIV